MHSPNATGFPNSGGDDDDVEKDGTYIAMLVDDDATTRASYNVHYNDHF